MKRCGVNWTKVDPSGYQGTIEGLAISILRDREVGYFLVCSSAGYVGESRPCGGTRVPLNEAMRHAVEWARKLKREGRL